MIDTILFIAKVLLVMLPFVILCFFSKKVNLDKSQRSKQFPMPVITLVYAVLGMVFMDFINEFLIWLFNNLPGWVLDLAEISWMPGWLANAFEGIGLLLEDLFALININFWVFFISNTALIILYLIIKKICMGIIKKTVKSDSALHTKIADNFYEYIPESDAWYVKENFSQVRGMLKVFYYAAVVLSVLLTLAAATFYRFGFIKTVFYPVFGILIVGELYFYLDGITKNEQTGDIFGEDEDAYKVANYSLLRKFLRSIFGDKLLSENTGVNNSAVNDVTTDDIIRELENNEDPKVVTFAAYFDALNKAGYSVDHNYLYSSLDMLNKKSILFNNPFYNDLIPYAFYPMNRVLLSHRKALVVLGRHAVEEDIRNWIQKGIESVTNIPHLWKIGILDSQKRDLDIGIVTRSDVLDIEMHNANSDFLENVGFVVILEPSRLISTAQIGLNLLIKKCRADGNEDIVYCMSDKNCDGLVDAMSHILMTSITEVSATKKHLGTSSYMCWEADDEYLHHRLVPNISRYLGVGTELSFAALKNQVSKTKWYGGDAFPVTDMHWIGMQYYYDLTKYANLPTTPETMDERFYTTPNFWSAEVEKNTYLTVEDESFNMFEILRDFSTRTTEQGFINVISSDYLLKDYMADNASIFEADAKAIPCIVADYTRSNRNAVLRLILMMSTYPINSDILRHELSLLGIRVYDLKKQLWFELCKCYYSVADITLLPEDYNEAMEGVYAEPLRYAGKKWTKDIIRVEERYNLKIGALETVYSISDPEFLAVCVSGLRSACYVAEDEKGQNYYLGAELNSHIYQKYLPGQFFTFGGKYYEMQYVTADGQVLVRRAADHINSRSSYRQVREYTIHGIKASDKIGACQNISGMKVIKEFADISVSTPGYYRMERYNDFKTAKLISFEGDKNGIPERRYFNKEILRIVLPDMGGKLTDNIRYTVALLFNEVFKTIFAENQAYICAVTDTAFLGEDACALPNTYKILGDEGYELDRASIYIIEDSQLDLGLCVSVERNLQRIFGIVHDYLDWHKEKLEESIVPPEDPVPPITFTDPETGEPIDPKKEKERLKELEKERLEKEREEEAVKGKKKGFFGRIGSAVKNFFGKLFRRKPKKDKKKPKDEDSIVPEDKPLLPENDEAADTPVTPENEEQITDTEPSEQAPADNTPDEDKDPSVDADAAVEADGDAVESEETAVKEEIEMAESPLTNENLYSADTEDEDEEINFAQRKPYNERYYMLYGDNAEPAFIDIMGTMSYLTQMGFDRNPLKHARESRNIAELIEATFKPGKPDARYCDFCGAEIYGVEYETLVDGRDRCINCSRTAIKTGEEFRKIFTDVKRNLESFFGVKINAAVKVEMVNSKILHKRLGKAFIPTPEADGRVLGVAISDKDGYTLMVENGSPRMASMLTMAHELTHIWQYINWNDKAITKKYGKKLRLEIYEGMAKWVEIQYAYLINEAAVAKREELITTYRDDEYGHGFLRYCANYSFSTGTVMTKPTPFMNIDTPLDPIYCGPFRLQLPGDADDSIPKRPLPPVTDIPENPTKGTKERDPDMVVRYAYELLSDEEKAVYENVLNAINSFSKEVTQFGASVTDEQIAKIVDYIQRDHPELFWFQHGATYYFVTDTRVVSRLELKYCMTPEEAEARKQKINEAIAPFLDSVSERMSDYEVTLRIYENIIGLVDYDTIGLERQKKTTLCAEIPDDLRSIYGVFVNKKAVCAGYAKALQYLLNIHGIECTYITSDTHAWNLIKLEGDYYHIDVTWGDGSDTKKDKITVEAINYDCFCITSEELARLEEHIPDNKMFIPECTAAKCNYHRRHGLYFEKFDFDKLRAVVCDKVNNNELYVTFKFSPAIFNEAKKQLIDNGRFREALQYSNLKSDIRINTNYSYSVKDDKLTMSFFMDRI